MSLAMDFRRHAPLGRARRPASGPRPLGLAHLYASPKRRLVPDLYVTDRAEARRGGGFRWFFSTLLAGGVGTVAIAAVIFGSMDAKEGGAGILPALKNSVRQQVANRKKAPAIDRGLAWSIPKVDRLVATTGAMSTKYILQEPVTQRRANRDYIHKKPYARVVIRLAAVPATDLQLIPRFDPVKLLTPAAGSVAATDVERQSSRPEGGELAVRLLDLPDGILPAEDGQEIDNQEAQALVRRVFGVSEEATIRPGFMPEGAELARDGSAIRGRLAGFAERALPNTSIFEKTLVEADDVPDDIDIEGRRVKARLGKGENLQSLLRRFGADTWLARSMVDAAKSIQAENVAPDSEIEVGLLPSLSQANKLEPARLTVTSESGEHRLSIWRNAAGDFVASTNPADVGGRSRGGESHAATLYASLYHAALAHGIAPDTIDQILRVHATETEFRRRPRGSDGAEMFFDLKEEERGTDGALGELLFTSITVGGETRRYFRFRMPDGSVDFYDDNGSNSRKFLMKHPFRGDEVKFNNGFGMRAHPLLGGLRMHTGIDFAGPIGTPILAAGTGVIEEARYKGQNGNYVRIRHANGYQTAYSHMNKFAPVAREGAKVVQGQIIGYIGTSGLSTGPHLHYEVLIGNRFVDPQKVPDQRDRRLTGKFLAEFQRERLRIEEAMRRPPVRVVQLEAK